MTLRQAIKIFNSGCGAVVEDGRPDSKTFGQRGWIGCPGPRHTFQQYDKAKRAIDRWKKNAGVN